MPSRASVYVCVCAALEQCGAPCRDDPCLHSRLRGVQNNNAARNQLSHHDQVPGSTFGKMLLNMLTRCLYK